ncbi:hypothetical protein J6590_043799 [Homalodisca vitripennis]|nr:hypothetical protein J6590_043799 [Homalodisca vitripennis]
MSLPCARFRVTCKWYRISMPPSHPLRSRPYVNLSKWMAITCLSTTHERVLLLAFLDFTTLLSAVQTQFCCVSCSADKVALIRNGLLQSTGG